MNELIKISNQTKMDSREIAELTGKRHADVCRDIRKQLEVQKIAGRNFASGYLDKNNQDRVCFKLDYDQVMILLTGYSITLRAKVIKRWKELEEKNEWGTPTTFSEALKLAYEQSLVIENQNKQIIENAPKVKVHNQIMNSEGLILPTDAGRSIMGKPNKFTKWLQEVKVLYKRSKYKPLRPTARFVEKGYLVLKAVYNESQDKTYNQTYFTPEGLVWITNKWNKLQED